MFRFIRFLLRSVLVDLRFGTLQCLGFDLIEDLSFGAPASVEYTSNRLCWEILLSLFGELGHLPPSPAAGWRASLQGFHLANRSGRGKGGGNAKVWKTLNERDNLYALRAATGVAG
jgi:hypothetical protein